MGLEANTFVYKQLVYSAHPKGAPLSHELSRSRITELKLDNPLECDFYLRHPISQKPSHRLSWAHYAELKVDNEKERTLAEAGG